YPDDLESFSTEQNRGDALTTTDVEHLFTPRLADHPMDPPTSTGLGFLAPDLALVDLRDSVVVHSFGHSVSVSSRSSQSVWRAQGESSDRPSYRSSLRRPLDTTWSGLIFPPKTHKRMMVHRPGTQPITDLHVDPKYHISVRSSRTPRLSRVASRELVLVLWRR